MLILYIIFLFKYKSQVSVNTGCNALRRILCQTVVFHVLILLYSISFTTLECWNYYEIRISVDLVTGIPSGDHDSHAIVYTARVAETHFLQPGTCRVTPTVGVALTDLFSVNCTEYGELVKPVTFLFYILDIVDGQVRGDGK